MYLLIIILKKESLLNDLAKIMLECSFYNTTILDGEGLENIVSQNMPVFNEITAFFGTKLAYNRTIISVVDNVEDLKYFNKLCKKMNIDFNNEEIGFLTVIKCENINNILEGE